MIDHLHNGVHYSITDERIIEETASVPTTNVSSERDFAVLNRYLREKPNAQLISLEAIILFAHNKTSFWMAHLSREEREELFQVALKLAPAFKEKFKGKRQEIEMKRKQDMEKKIEENTRKELRAAQEKENLTKKIQEYGGLWTKRGEVECTRITCNEEERSSEIANEFSKKVLGQAHNNKEVFKFSKNKRQLSIPELKQN